MLNRTLLSLALCLTLVQVGFAQSPADPLAIDAKHQKDLDADKAEGEKYVKEVEKQFKISKDEAMQARAQRIGAEMAEIANRTKVQATWGDKRFSKFTYTFKVLEGKDNVNAFSLPGGYIYIYEGLMNFIESDDELAAVIGHEIAHASLRHVASLQKEAGKVQAIQLPLILAAIFAGGKNAGTGVQAIYLGSQAMASGWSVKAEKAADFAGFQYIEKSKYNPTACLTVVERLAAKERNLPNIDWGIFRTHPPSADRVVALNKDLKNNNVVLQRSAVTTSFSTQLKKNATGVEAWFNGKLIYTFTGDDAEKRAEAAEKRLNSFFDSMPEMYDIQANGDTIVGARKTLIEVSPTDAAAAKSTVRGLADRTVSSLRGAVYSLSFQTRQSMP